WFALADTQWDYGVDDVEARENALFHLRSKTDLQRWEEAGPSAVAKRAAVLQKLEDKLQSPLPELRKPKKTRSYHCQWKVGDVYAYPLESAYAEEKGLKGRYFIFHKIREDIWYPEHVIPVVRVKITDNDVLPTTEEELNQLPYMQIRRNPWGRASIAPGKTQEEVADQLERLPSYTIELMNTSSRIIPKSLVYLGNFPNLAPPDVEFLSSNPSAVDGFLWKSFDKIMIDRYLQFNK
ncbi:MAG: hypothetical protein J6D21_06670, partial [Clostridia bacterium]|nr:hypothetical protein [Clostridia bacterium]